MSTRLVPRINSIALLAAMVLVLGVLQPADANEPSRISSMSIEGLKGIYLECEKAAAASKLNNGDVMYCSLVYEELKEKAFEGDFGRIRSWLDRHSMLQG